MSKDMSVTARIATQTHRINAGVANGTIDPTKAAQDMANLAAVQAVTGSTQFAQLALNRNSNEIYAQKHPGQGLPAPSQSTGGMTPAGGGTTAQSSASAPSTGGRLHVDSNGNIILNNGTSISPDQNGGIVLTSSDGTQTAAFNGDPHAQTAAGNFDVQGTGNGQGFQIVEAGGTVINVSTSPPDSNGASYITGVTATGPGGNQATLSGITVPVADQNGNPVLDQNGNATYQAGTPSTSAVTHLKPGSADFTAARQLSPNQAILTNAGTINGQPLGMNFATMEPGTSGTLGEITGGSNLTGYQFDPSQVALNNVNAVNNLITVWNSLVPNTGTSGGQ